MLVYVLFKKFEYSDYYGDLYVRKDLVKVFSTNDLLQNYLNTVSNEECLNYFYETTEIE
jgi:hypothetical protein